MLDFRWLYKTIVGRLLAAVVAGLIAFTLFVGHKDLSLAVKQAGCADWTLVAVINDHVYCERK